MDLGTNCPICLSEYTTNGDHRIASLPCGHLFGSGCIEQWLKDKVGTKFCPTCSKKANKRQIRLIFATKVLALDTTNEQKLVDKLIQEQNEKKELERRNHELKSEIECLKLEIENINSEQSFIKEDIIEGSIHKKFKKIIRTDFNTQCSEIFFDEINFILIVTCRKGKTVGYQKYGCNEFNLKQFYGIDDKKFFIDNACQSPFKDGLALFATNKKIELINLYNNNRIYYILTEKDVTSLCFDPYDRNLLYYGDVSGTLHFRFLDNSNESTLLKLDNVAIHSIYVCSSGMYAGTINRAYKIQKDDSSSNYNIIEIEQESYICTNISGYENNVLITFRNSSFQTAHYIFGKKEVLFSSNLIQTKKHKDKIFNGFIYIVDDNYKTLRIFSLEKFEAKYSYSFKQQIIDFYINNSFLFVLTSSEIHIFDSKS